MNAPSPIFLFSPIIAILLSVACFWLISKKTPKGVVVGLAIIVWVIGNVIGSQQARELMMIGGSIKMAGSVGIILGIIDLFRKKKPNNKK
ncbi:MAG: hypothetical protein K9L86_05015 [Candidatus Omnitrophica bacterium]|nr:hypothetical protein [Candidatus Omnitrophota bacterium]